MRNFPHRALAILLKRDLLQDYSLSMSDGVKRLLKGKDVVIKLKDSAADTPVFLKAKPRGSVVSNSA